MAQRISYNKAQELANAIEGAEVKTYQSGNVAIVLNSKVAIDNWGEPLPAEPMMPLTKYNKITVSMAEAKELIKEKFPFVLAGEKLKGVWQENSYLIKSSEVTIFKCTEPYGIWENVTTESLEVWDDATPAKKRLMSKHIDLVEEALNND